MTDWLPWGFVFMASAAASFVTLLRAVAQTAPAGPNLRAARRTPVLGACTTLLAFLAYVGYVIFAGDA
ncbi:MAG: hypothetical protein LC623_06570 [Halobacteriales archaeon]|nr:hypothetical protein [Halobacteriales archaeon]